METLIITGGDLDIAFANDYIKDKQFDYLIAVDRGLEFFERTGRVPNLLVGDFDSIESVVLEKYVNDPNVEVREFNPHKDYTDTELALSMAIEKKSTKIHMLGAFGSRVDHMLGTIKTLGLALEAGVPCLVVDECNRLQLIDKTMVIKKEEQYGKYVSLIPLTEEVTGITLRGFEYLVNDFTMSGFHALGVSNQIVEETAVIELANGILILVESKDKKSA